MVSIASSWRPPEIKMIAFLLTDPEMVTTFWFVAKSSAGEVKVSLNVLVRGGRGSAALERGSCRVFAKNTVNGTAITIIIKPIITKTFVVERLNLLLVSI